MFNPFLELPMPPRPKASLDDLTVPKGVEPATVAPDSSPVPAPAPAAPAETPGLKNYAHTLSLRLTAEQYRRLRRYVARGED